MNLADFNRLASYFGATGATYSQGDINYDGLVNLADFNLLSGRFGAVLPEPPTSPNEITAGLQTSSSITLTWLDSVDGETGYRVQQSTDGQTFDVHYNRLAGSGGAEQQFLVPNLQDGTRYWFRVRAYSDPGTNPSGPNTAYTPKRAATTVLPAPTITSATALSSSQIKILFTDNSQNETSFQVYRSTSPTGTFSPVGNPIPSGAPTEFTDTGLNPGTTYYYRVLARNAVIDSSPSNTANATTSMAGMSLNATPIGADQIDLSWTAFAGAATYLLELSVDGVDWHESIDMQIAQTSTSLFGFDEGPANENNHIRVVAVDGNGQRLATSNVRVVTSPGVAPGEAKLGPETALGASKLLLGLNGHYIPGGDPLGPYGNQWFEMMVHDTGLSVKPGGGAYRHQDWRQGLLELLNRIDANNDSVISAAEDEAAEVILTGYSWGANSAVNISRKLRDNSIDFGSETFTLQVDIGVDLLITIDPVRRAYFSAPRLLKPVRGRVETNVERFVNFYQRRGTSTSFWLYLPNSSNNGQNFNEIYRQRVETVSVPFEGVKADPVGHRLQPANVVQTNINDLVARHATNVEFFEDPLHPLPQTHGNWFDGNLTAGQAQHDTMPF